MVNNQGYFVEGRKGWFAVCAPCAEFVTRKHDQGPHPWTHGTFAPFRQHCKLCNELIEPGVAPFDKADLTTVMGSGNVTGTRHRDAA